MLCPTAAPGSIIVPYLRRADPGGGRDARGLGGGGGRGAIIVSLRRLRRCYRIDPPPGVNVTGRVSPAAAPPPRAPPAPGGAPGGRPRRGPGTAGRSRSASGR